MIRALSLFALALMVASVGGCVSHNRSDTLLEPSATLKVGDSFYMSVFELRGHKLTSYALEKNYTIRSNLQRTALSAAQEAEFWSVMDEQQVTCWRHEYVNVAPEERSAYTSWKVIVRKAGVDYASMGTAAYPADEDPRLTKTNDESKRFLAVYFAFAEPFRDAGKQK